MFIKSSLCFTLIAAIIAGNGMAKYLLVDVAEEKGISDQGDEEVQCMKEGEIHCVESFSRCCNGLKCMIFDALLLPSRCVKDDSDSPCQWGPMDPHCGCANRDKRGCPEGMVCCSCIPCMRCNECHESCEGGLWDREIPAICNITNVNNAWQN